MKALVWLANQLSVSQDSCERILLLISELPKLDLKRIRRQEFGEAPWFSIFDLLGRKYLKSDPNDSIGANEMRAFEILIQCDQIDFIHDIIQPSEIMPFILDPTSDRYWTQHCDTRTDRWIRMPISTDPNSLFLLLRDVPLLPEYNRDEIKAIIQFSRWRNSSKKQLDVWKELLDFALTSSPFAFEAFVKTFCQFLRSQDHMGNYHNESRFVEILDRIVRYQVEERAQVQPPTLDLLLRSFEQVVTWKPPKPTVSPICRPACYSTMLWYSSTEAHTLHCLFILLLSRCLSTYFDEEIVPRTKEALAMLSLRPSYPFVEHQMFSKVAAFHYWDGTDDPSGLSDMDLTEWIREADAIPHIYEILHRLAATQAKQPEIGPLWRVLSPPSANIHFVDALQVFDRMMSHSITTEQHHMLISLVCEDLELGESDSFAEYFTVYRLKSLEELRDPCLIFLAQSALGRDDNRLPLSFDPPTDLWKASWIRIADHMIKHHENTRSPPILRLKATIWPVIAGHPIGLCKKALKDPQALAHLQRIFDHPIVSCPQHHDGVGHMLLHVFEHVESCTFFVKLVAITTIPVYGRLFDVLLMILAVSDEDQLDSEELDDLVDEDCLERLLEICRVVKASQFSLLSLLCDLVTVLTKTEGLAAKDVELVSICIKNTLLLPQDNRISSIIPLLTLRIGLLRDEMLNIGYRDPAENEVASNGATRAIEALKARLATVTVFGGRNNTMISCARTSDGHSPAVGWSFIHVA